MLFFSQHNTYRSFQILALSLIQSALLFSCAEVQMESSDGVYPTVPPANGGVNREQVSNGSISSCEQIQVDLPLADSTLSNTQVRVAGTVIAKDGINPEFIGIDQEIVPVSNGQFDTVVQRQAGAHTMVLSCIEHRVCLLYTSPSPRD